MPNLIINLYMFYISNFNLWNWFNYHYIVKENYLIYKTSL